MYLMMKHAFELGYRRYEWKCDALNAKSRIAAQRLGLSYEGVFRQATVYKERNRDTAWYAAYAATSPPFGWTRVEDQQMGGLIMWIPGGTIYMAMALLRVRDAVSQPAGPLLVRPART